MVFARRLQPLSRADKAPTGFGVPVRRIGAQKPVAVRCANDIYRPVSCRAIYYYLKGVPHNFYYVGMGWKALHTDASFESSKKQYLCDVPDSEGKVMFLWHYFKSNALRLIKILFCNSQMV